MESGNFCDICYDNAVYTCHDCCNKMFCTGCCTKIHQHPNRQEHNISYTLLTSSHENNTELTCDEESSMDYDTPSSQDDETDRLSMMVATLAERFDSTQFRESEKEVYSIKRFEWL